MGEKQLKVYFQQTIQSENITSQWNSSIIINIDKVRKIKKNAIIKGVYH